MTSSTQPLSELLGSVGVPPVAAMYAIAVFGSVAVELAALLREVAANEGKLPARYRTRTFPIVRVLFTFLAAGPLAILLSAQTDLAAFYVGISAPLVFDRAASGIKPNGTGAAPAADSTPSAK